MRPPRLPLLPLLVLSVWAPLAGPLLADAVRLNGGQILEGEILSESEDDVTIRTVDGTFVIPRVDVLEMEKGAARDLLGPSPRPDAVTTALMGFIPFYSGLFQTRNDFAGVPLAAANGFSALGLLSTALAHPMGFEGGQGWQWRQMPGMLALSPAFLSDVGISGIDPGMDSRFLLLVGANTRSPEYRATRLANGEVTSEARARELRDDYLKGYAVASLLNVGLAYFNLRFQGGRPFFSSPVSNRTAVGLLVSPVAGGMAFALSARF